MGHAALQEMGYAAFQQGVHPTSDPTVPIPLMKAATELITALDRFDEGTIRIGNILIIKSIRNGKPSLQVTTLSSVLVEQLDANPTLLGDPTTLHSLITHFPMQTPLSFPAYDVFLCHNGDDKPAVEDIAGQLQQRGIRPWLDEWALRPGDDWLTVLEQQIVNIPVAAVFIGPCGEGPWQAFEYHALLQEYVNKQRRVIPVILPGYEGSLQLPTFLRAFHYVGFRQTCPQPLDALVRGIRG
jgi:hypothetical protein